MTTGDPGGAAPPEATKPLLLLVDGHSLAFRSFYAFAKGGEGGLSTKAGIPTSVTYGFLKALLENGKGLSPQGVVIAFDTAEPTFRHQADATYKAHRDEAPEQFFADLANLQQILRQDLDIPLCMAPGYEADDVLGTLANRAANAGWRVRILSGDRDLFQLVDDERDIAVLYMGGGPYAKGSGPIQINREAVIARLGVPPEEVVDLKALTGDSSDNIPGVKGVGPKTAITLLRENGHLDGVYATLDKLTGPKDGQGAIKGSLKAKLLADRENAYRSRMLAEILVDIPLPAEPRLGLGAVKVEALAASLERLELHSLGRQAQNFAQLLSAGAASASGNGVGASNGGGGSGSGSGGSSSSNLSSNGNGESGGAGGEATAATQQAGELAMGPAAAAATGPETSPEPPALTPQLITTAPALAALVQRLEAATDPAAPIALDTETTALNPFEAELVGIGLCWGEGLGDLAYIPIAHQASPQQPSPQQSSSKQPHAPQAADATQLPIEQSQPGEPAGEPSVEPRGEPPAAQLPLDLVLGALAPWLASPGHPKTLQNAKYDRLVLLRHGLGLAGVVMDTLLADYLRDANAKHSLEVLAQRNYGFTPISFTALVPKGANFASVPVADAANYCGMDVHLTWRLTGLLRRQLAELGPALPQLLREVELPLEPVLAAMEATGIRIDTAVLARLSQELAASLASLELQARQAAGGVEFNLASPKQLGELLFDQLGLDRKKSRKTKTGWSTDAAVLEKLEDAHPVVPLVLEHRTLSKLKSTYVDALPALVEPETGRVHTDFNQAVTATGRLSSSNPNLQNIPIRNALSRQIRQAFLPQEGWQMLSADYSQIELRILAHLSGEDVLINAFKNKEDVHALTARLLLDKEQVNADERRLGKTINFGVIYGMGAQRFARETGVSQGQAKEFLSRYRQRYPKVFAYLELQERLALSRGYVETILGRRRPFHFDPSGLGRLLGREPMDIDLEVARRGGMEAQQLRAAANAPIQGSSADIIKLAMVQLHRQLEQTAMPAHLLLQVHDELVLEVAPEALEAVRTLTRDCMEQAITLSVPLVADIGSGRNWMEAK